ncbi:MAG: hypothetical protein ER33_05605 [Cyanobium sp. CACIAM 14]|nr:MAG: hypothetical protein ER33_05605 [Cyanobium sp. CACIAM 14]
MRWKRWCQGSLLAASVLLARPAFAEPCLTAETLAWIQSRLGEMAAAAFLAGTGLSLCGPVTSDAMPSSLQRIDELSAEDAMNPEQIACPPSSGLAMQRQGLIPEAGGSLSSSASTKICTCPKLREALRVAQEALRSRGQ